MATSSSWKLSFFSAHTYGAIYNGQSYSHLAQIPDQITALLTHPTAGLHEYNPNVQAFFTLQNWTPSIKNPKTCWRIMYRGRRTTAKYVFQNYSTWTFEIVVITLGSDESKAGKNVVVLCRESFELTGSEHFNTAFLTHCFWYLLNYVLLLSNGLAK